MLRNCYMLFGSVTDFVFREEGVSSPVGDSELLRAYAMRLDSNDHDR
jgi:hypothetical protein